MRLEPNTSRRLKEVFGKVIHAGHGAATSQPLILLAAFSLFVAATSFPQMLRPFWYDEIVTFHVAQLSGVAEIWRELRNGADLNPPFFYIATAFSHAILGASEFSTRLPQLAGFLIMCFGIHAFVGKYGNASAALAAMVFPMLTAAPEFAAEARPYGLVLGFSSVAAVSWQRASRLEYRAVALAALGLSLLGALQSHGYAVIVIAAFVVAEAARSSITRKLDWPVIAAIAIPSLSVVLYLFLLPSMAGDQPDLNPIFRTTPPEGYRWLLSPGLLPLAVLLTLCALLAAHSGRARNEEAKPEMPPIPPWELLLAVCLAASPVVVWLIQVFFTHMGYPRYGLAAVIGFSILFGMLTAFCVRDRRESGLVMLLAVILFLIPLPFPTPTASLAPLPDVAAFLEKEKLPVVIANPLAFIEINRYAKVEFSSRVFYLASAERARTYLGVGVVDKYFETKLPSIIPLRGRIVQPDAFFQENHRFFVLSDFYGDLEWLPKHLQRLSRNLLYRGRMQFDGRVVTLIEVLPELERKPGP